MNSRFYNIGSIDLEDSRHIEKCIAWARTYTLPEAKNRSSEVSSKLLVGAK